MAFWETMTIAEMSLLLEKKAQPDIRMGWKRLSELIGQIPAGQKSKTELSDCPLTPAVYFFLCVWESARHTAHSSLFKSIKVNSSDAAALPEFGVSGSLPNNTNAFRYVFTPGSAEMMRLYPPTASLDKLLKGIREDNYSQWEQAKSTQYLMKKGLDNLERILNIWDEPCQMMLAIVKHEEDPAFRKIYDLVEGGVKQIILTGAPGTGKTRTAGLAAQYMGTPLVKLEYSAEPRHPCTLVQFHPSYDYTDFVEGLRPVQLEGQTDGTASFVKLDGSFKAFCRSVARENMDRTKEPKNDPDRRYFFLIDEINRADLSKVFGELMFCLEAGKRGRSMQTQYGNLPTYAVDSKTRRAVQLEEDIFADGFFIPENVVLLGTMNDIDRSVESMDFALRRRFVFWEVKVDEAMLTRAFASGGFGQVLKDNARTAAQRVMALNGVIDRIGGQFGLNQHFYISQGQFAGLPEKPDLNEMLCSGWEFRIEPLLREYVRGEEDVESFLKKCAEALEVGPGEQERNP